MKKDDNQVNVAKEDGIGELATWEVYTKYQNRTTISLDTIREELGMGSWAARVSHNDTFQGVFLQQHPGEGNRKHYHPDAWENWIIMDGEWEWWIDGQGTKIVKTGDSVIVPPKTWHKITCVGDKPGVRYAMTKPDVVHIFEENDNE